MPLPKTPRLTAELPLASAAFVLHVALRSCSYFSTSSLHRTECVYSDAYAKVSQPAARQASLYRHAPARILATRAQPLPRQRREVQLPRTAFLGFRAAGCTDRGLPIQEATNCIFRP